ncbi:MAG: hypothetical protein FWD71_06150 [Oscillospiraceae bacterium]|nr:hypothetical protein [Oscillospiraceae bacterium]
MLKISSSGTSNPGKKKINEDNFYMNGIYVAEGNAVNGAVYSDNNRRRIQFYAVFDGIGDDVKSDINTNMNFYDGQNSSFIAADMLAKLQRHLKTKQEYGLDDYILRYIRKTNKNICDYMRQKSIRTGSSFALLCFDKNTICAYNVGNSKIFILRDNRITLLSQNDTKVESLIMAKQVSADIARYTPDNKILTQHLGVFDDEKSISVHINEKLTLRNGDKFLVCSDGLCDYLTNERIYQILSRDISETEIVRDLVIEAMQNGGRDNLTIIVVGVNYTDDSVNSQDILRPTSNVPTNFSPLPYRNSFILKPKHIKQIATIGFVVILFIIAIVVIFNGPFKFFAGEPPAVTTKSNTQQSDSVTSDTNETSGTTDITTNNFNIPTGSDGTTDINSTTAADSTGNTDNYTTQPTTPAQATQRATDAPAVTNPPATSPPATKAPVTNAPTTEAPTAAPATTETPATITAEQTTEIQTSETVASTEEITAEITEPSTPAETVPEETITEPPATNPPASPSETEPPVTIQEETIAAENPGDSVQEES